MKLTRFTNKERSLKSERALAKMTGGKTQPASGAVPRFDLKGDVISKHHLFDDKVTGRKTYTLNLASWKVLRKQAWQNKRKPAMRILFENDGDQESLFVIGEIDFYRLLDALAKEI